MIRFAFGKKKPGERNETARRVKAELGPRSIVLVGLMGCGKTSVGRRLANRLNLRFVDADEEIETAAGKSIKDIFSEHGEAHFRDGERKVIARLLRDGPQVLATGGGAFMNADIRKDIADAGISVWLRAELPILMQRVLRRDNRPLLMSKDPEAVMRDLMATRYPVYAQAHVTVDSRDVPHDVIVSEIIAAVAHRFAVEPDRDGAATDPVSGGCAS